MLSNSVVTRTGQLWKLVAAVAALLIGSFAPLWAASGITWTTGTIIAVAGYVFGCLFIRCPACGNRWMWSAALDALLYKPVFTTPTCPACQQSFARQG